MYQYDSALQYSRNMNTQPPTDTTVTRIISVYMFVCACLSEHACIYMHGVCMCVCTAG